MRAVTWGCESRYNWLRNLAHPQLCLSRSTAREHGRGAKILVNLANHGLAFVWVQELLAEFRTG